ncbi:hypothetical protein A6E14_17245 [Vibrio genomosp. F10]|uniref:Uncharacterized protein n=2 Tax=Vibrio genomosp. F10 TaxID=723171 RepID=A0A1B9R2M3_9VIBR|nr:hypothetical protein A6E14_17245 [Vibrio genomosp. F10]OEE33260.1 hypothetical protein A1QO_09920 [Vibrio genomosp. F10 str. ZF-129]OEE92808.1 hypothetical protein A1QM_11310 [Vibrio genomosp. F10 str. 9ZC157]OEE95825.1 hypothetical protein A1QK_14720 [Vibrio genomosp. F10 str. 9ZD137]OEF08578.1 hypothetical protein A1QI_16260 [Vibrio genomosp. F10 str. 9ZB36]
MHYITIMTGAILFLSFSSVAGSVSLRWVGKVPTLSCAEAPLSNQIDFVTLKNKCPSEFVKKAVQSEPKNIKMFVSFNL